MARRIGVEIVADSSQLEKAMARSAKSATNFNRDISKATRGAVAGTGIFHSFGRSIAFASGGFLAFEGVTKFLTDSINAAREAGVAQRSLAAQMKASGQSFAANREQIEKVSLSYGRFGFQNDEVIASLTVLERGTRNINTAIRLQGLAADLARAKNIGLADAANIVAKVFGGQETALRRAVPGLEKHAHGYDLIRQAQARLAGQAAANTTSAERFAATLHDTEEIIGAGLLPTLNKYLDSLSTWMQDTKNQAKLQRAANSTAKLGAQTFRTLAEAISLAADAVDKYNTAISHLPGGKKGQLQRAVNVVTKGNIFDIVGFLGHQLKLSAQDFHIIDPNRPITARQPGRPGGADRPARFDGGAVAAATEAAIRRVPRPTSLQGRFNIQELKLTQAQLTQTLADDRKILVIEQGITEQQIKSAKTLKDKTALTKQLVGIQGQILSIDQAGAAAAADTAKSMQEQTQTLKDRADAIKSAVLDQLQRKQTGITNQRALTDALAGLRTARLLGGPAGLRLAKQGVEDARMAILQATLEAAPARLTKGGQFTLGNTITVNIHGVTDPDKVAKAVVAIIKRQQRHTTTQSRGPTPGAH